jgi:hypothetical protein
MEDLAHEHPGQREVVSVLTRAGGLTRRVDHGDRFTNYRKITH